MAEINRVSFAADVTDMLAHIGLSYGQAVERWPDTNKAMWSRAAAAQKLSAGNYLLVCRCLGLDPFAYLDSTKRTSVRRRRRGRAPPMSLSDIAKAHCDQTVTPPVIRETEGGEPCSQA